MRWPWRRHLADRAERAQRAAVMVARARARLRLAEQQTPAIVRRADRLARELGPGELVSRVADAISKRGEDT